MNDPWTRTTVWGLTVGAGGGMGRGRQRGKNWDNCNRITIKTMEIVSIKIEEKQVRKQNYKSK